MQIKEILICETWDEIITKKASYYPEFRLTYSSRHLVKSLIYQAMALMTQGIAMMLYGSSERFRLSRHEKGLPSGNKDTLAI